MGWFARHVLPTVIPAKTGIRLPARHMGYGREMGSRIRGNDEEGRGVDGQLPASSILLPDIREFALAAGCLLWRLTCVPPSFSPLLL